VKRGMPLRWVGARQGLSDRGYVYLLKKALYARSINDPTCREAARFSTLSHLRYKVYIILLTRVTSVSLPVSHNTCTRWVLLGFAERYNVPDRFLELHRVFKATYLKFHYRFWCMYCRILQLQYRAQHLFLTALGPRSYSAPIS